MEELTNCHDCDAKPGQIHTPGCDVERCSYCGGQKMCCSHAKHDPAFARWTGLWPGKAECDALGITLNEVHHGLAEILYCKPGARSQEPRNVNIGKLRDETEKWKERLKKHETR